MRITPRFLLYKVTEFYYEVWDRKKEELIPMTEFQWNIRKRVYIDAREVNHENDPMPKVQEDGE